MASAFPRSLERLVALLSELPGIGRKSAARIALKLVESSEPECRALADGIVEARAKFLDSFKLPISSSDKRSNL